MQNVISEKDIGLKRLHALANMKAERQLDLIAEGVPVLMKSANGLLRAARKLEEDPRSAAILSGQAQEELAKILILMDFVRCPASLRKKRVRTLTGWFYSHLARLIYIEAQHWKPTSVAELQRYVDTNRKAHSVDGSEGEFISPNWLIYQRESDMYADVFGGDEGELNWNDPEQFYEDERLSRSSSILWQKPQIWEICLTLQELGAFSRKGIDIVASIWGSTDFTKEVPWNEARRLGISMIEQLCRSGQANPALGEDRLSRLLHSWQLPMYRVDFTPIKVSLNELRAEQEEYIGYSF